MRPIVNGFKASEDSSAENEWQSAKVNFYDSLLKDGLGKSHHDIETFLISAIEGREYAKFLFSRNVSDALELIAEFGSELGLDRNQLSNLPLVLFLVGQK